MPTNAVFRDLYSDMNISEVINNLSSYWQSGLLPTVTNNQNDRNWIVDNTNKQYIHSFNYIPRKFNFHKIKDEEELYMGVELEIDGGGNSDFNAKKVIDWLGEQHVYCKNDGTLSNGFEIVTHPCTCEYHLTLPYENLFKELIKLGYRSHDTSTCGLHIHFNKSYFGKDKLSQDIKISELLFIVEKFWNKFITVARRNSQYAKRHCMANNDSLLDLYAKSKSRDKHYAINPNGVNKTCEIRLYKGTLNYQTFIHTLNFTKRILMLIKDTDIYEVEDLTWTEIYETFDNDLKNFYQQRKNNKKDNIDIGQAVTFQNGSLISWDTVDESSVRGGCGEFYYIGCDTCLSGSIEEQDLISQLPVYNINTMSREQLKREARNLNKQISRSRNYLEQQRLRRELQEINVQLRRIRH